MISELPHATSDRTYGRMYAQFTVRKNTRHDRIHPTSSDEQSYITMFSDLGLEFARLHSSRAASPSLLCLQLELCELCIVR